MLPAEIFPAGVDGISVRRVDLRSGITVRVAEAGAPDGIPLVLLHGWGASIYMFRHILEAPPAGFRVIAADLRGFGLSDAPANPNAYSLNAYCDDVDALLDALALPVAALLGQSMGGGLALRYALARPERTSKLVLINPIGLVSIAGLRALQRLPGEILDRVGARPPRWLVAWILHYVAYGDASLVSERDIDEYWSLTQLPGYTHAAAATLDQFEWNPLTDAEATSLSVPSLVILGERDHLIHNTPASARRLNGARVERVPGGHCAHEEHPNVVYPMVASFAR